MTKQNEAAATAPAKTEPVLFGTFVRVFSREIVAEPAANSVVFSMIFNLAPFALSGAMFMPGVGGFGPGYMAAALAVLAVAAWSKRRGWFPGGEAAVRKVVGRLHGVRWVFAISGISVMTALNMRFGEDLWSAPPPFLIAVAVFAGMSGVACGAVDFAVYAFWEKRSPRELLALKRKGGSDVN